jgi:putative ABC transport system ATP-binding protein|tara:strand:- start:160 stop:822 length:663 start_codon:yes stop_codon:yes gene_type:complete
MIKITNLHKSYNIGKNKLHVLKGLNLSIGAGEMVSIMGSSGSGKSTLLNILGILDSYNEGEYVLNNTLIKKLTETKAAKLRNQYLGFVFQSFNLISYKNAAENVALPLYYQKVNRKERMKRANQFLEMVGLDDRAEHLPSELSGGQQQRVAIARALVSNPKVILADEPTGALDSATSNEVMNIFRTVNKQGITVILVTHEEDIAKQSDRIIRLKDGEIIN